MTANAPRLPIWLDPLIAEAKRRMRRRRLRVVALLVLIGVFAAVGLFTARATGGPGSTGPGGGQNVGTLGHGIERAFASRGDALTRASTLPELCDRSACIGLVVWGGGKFTYLVPKFSQDFAIIIFQVHADAQRVAQFTRSHEPAVGAYVRGSTLLVYLKSSSRIARLRVALADEGQ